jgi:hypothetical protein
MAFILCQQYIYDVINEKKCFRVSYKSHPDIVMSSGHFDLTKLGQSRRQFHGDSFYGINIDTGPMCPMHLVTVKVKS